MPEQETAPAVYTWKADESESSFQQVIATPQEAAPAVEEVIETPEVVAEVIEDPTVEVPEVETPVETPEEAVVETPEVETPEEAPTEQVIDDFYKVEAMSMIEKGELSSEFNLEEEVTPDKIKEAWRNHNLGPIVQNAQNQAVKQVMTELNRSYKPETLEIARRMNNGVDTTDLHNLTVYKDYADTDTSQLELSDQLEYVSDYFKDKGVTKTVSDLAISGAEEAGTVEDLVKEAKEYFSASHSALDQQTKQEADRAQAVEIQLQRENQNFLNQVLTTGQLGQRQLSQEQVINMQQGMSTRTVPVDVGNGQKQNITEFEYFQKFILPSYTNQVTLYHLLLHENQVSQQTVQQAKIEAEKDAEIRWGKVRNVAIPEKATKIAAPKNTKKPEVKEEQYILSSTEGFQRI